MKIMSVLKIGVICLVMGQASSCKEKPLVDLDNSKAEQILRSALADSTDVRHKEKILVDNKAMACAIAEAYLFRIYGEDEIKNERPYAVALTNNYWVIQGSLPDGYNGGTFQIVLSSIDGQIVRLIHYR